MFYHLCAIALILLVLGMAAIRRCSLYSPIVISASIWLLAFVVGILHEGRFYPIQEKAFVAWLVWFLFTNTIFFLLYPSRVDESWNGTKMREIPFDYTFLLLLMIVWLSYRIWMVGSTGPEDFFLNLRLSAIGYEGFPRLGLVVRFYPLIFALFLFENLYENKENLHRRAFLWGFMLLYAIGTMGKLDIHTPFLSWIIIQGITGRLKFIKNIKLAVLTITLMLTLHFVRGSVYDIYAVSDVLSLYIYSPIVALGYMDIDSSLPLGAHIFRFFYVIGNILGFEPNAVGIFAPYVWIPLPANTYTVMQPFYYDFGILGVILGAVFYGLFFSILYFSSRKQAGFALVLYSGYSIALATQFIGELLFTFFSGNLHFLIYSIAVFLASRKVYYVG